MVSSLFYNGGILKWKEEILPLKKPTKFIIAMAPMYYHLHYHSWMIQRDAGVLFRRIWPTTCFSVYLSLWSLIKWSHWLSAWAIG